MKAVLRDLEQNGWQTKTHVCVGDIIVDAVAFRGEECILLEAKSGVVANRVACGVGQLFLYRKMIGQEDARLMLVLPEHPYFERLLSELGVETVVPLKIEIEPHGVSIGNGRNEV